MQQKRCILEILKFTIIIIIYQLVIVEGLTYNLKGKHGEGYLLDVSIGEPSQDFRVIVDTGSSNFAIAASKNQFTNTYFKYQSSKTFKSLNKNVTSKYTQGKWNGELGIDLLTLPTVPNIIKLQTQISLIKKSESFFKAGSGWQGLLGLAYPKISRPDSSILSYIDTFQRQTDAKCLSFSLELCGFLNDSKHFGNLNIIKNCDTDKSIFSALIVQEWYYQVSVVGISIGGEKLEIPCAAINNDRSIIDSGSTNLGLPDKVYDTVISSLYKYTLTHNITLASEFWDPKETSCFDTSQNWDMLPNISIAIAHNTTSYFILDLTSASYVKQIFSSESNELFHCYKVAIEKSNTGTILVDGCVIFGCDIRPEGP